MTRDGKIEIMVASSVYGYEDQIKQICGLFEQLGYHPVNSHYKTMPVDPNKSNLDNCLDAVRKSDAVFGIIRPLYGSGIIGPTSITHEEMKLAIALKKPRWFIAHRDVRVARVLLKQYMYRPGGAPRIGSFKRTDWKRTDKPRFPRLAIREALLNAVIHRDYSFYSSSIAINIYPDKLQISSYGKLPRGVTVKSLAEDHLSVPVNPDIAHIFFLRKWIEKIGIGTLKMINECKVLGFAIPTWHVTDNSVTVTFPGITVPFDYSEGISEGIREGLNKLIDEAALEGINEGISKGITETLRQSWLEIIELLI